jgi:hypothetical protein
MPTNPMTESLLAQDQKAKSISSNRRTNLIFGAVETATIAGIFGTFLTKAGQVFMEKTGHYILFPAAGALNFIRTGLALNQMRLESGKNGTKEVAVVEVGSSVLVGTAVIGGLAEAPYAKFAPHIFTAMLAGKSAFHGGSALYYLGKSAGVADEAEKEGYVNLAKVNGIVSTSLGFSALATGFVMILSQVDGFAEVGLASTIFATVFQAYHVYKMQTPTSSVTIEELPDDANEQEQDLESQYVPPTVTAARRLSSSSPAGIHDALGIMPTASSPSVNTHETLSSPVHGQVSRSPSRSSSPILRDVAVVVNQASNDAVTHPENRLSPTHR